MIRRLKMLEVSDCLVADVLRNGTPNCFASSDPLPDDAVLVAVSFDGRVIRLTYESSHFEEVAEGSHIPPLRIFFDQALSSEAVA